jgi:hypothetical protein
MIKIRATMKRLVFGVLAGMIILLYGCIEEEGYSLNKIWIGFGVVQQSESGAFKIVMDNDDVLIPVTSNSYGFSYGEKHDDHGKHIDTGDRLLVNYTILGDDINDEGEVEAFFVQLNSIKKILMKGILDITAANEDSIGNDPVIVQDTWLTDSLLTFKIKYWGQDKIHYINLVKQAGELNAANQPIELELRHNDNDDEENIPFAAYVSFKLNELKIAGQDSVRFVVKATDYEENDFTYEGSYVYGNED